MANTEDILNPKKADVPNEDVVDNTPHPAGNFVREAIQTTPAFPVMAGLSGPLDVINEGLNRYEAGKTELVTKVVLGQGVTKGLPDLIGAAKGTAKSEFTKDKYYLKHSDMPELGDIFRAAGMPEGVSALAGLAADVATDLIWGPVMPAITGSKVVTEAVKGVSELLKPAAKVAETMSSKATKVAHAFLENKGVQDFFKPIDEATAKLSAKAETKVPEMLKTAKESAGEWMDSFGKEYAKFMEESGASARIKATASAVKDGVESAIPDKWKAWYMSSKVKVAVDDTVDMLKGLGANSKLDPAFNDAMNIKDGKINVDSANGSYWSRQIKGLTTKNPAETSMINEALKGTISLDKLSPEARPIVEQARTIVKQNSERLAKAMEDLSQDDLRRMMEGQAIDPASPDSLLELQNKILNSSEDYQTRSYKAFTKGSDWVSDPLLKQKAAQAFVDEGWAKSTDEALNTMKQFEEKRQGGWTNFKKVNSKNLKQRKDLPYAFRQWLGEIEDPAYNLRKTLQTQSEIANTLDVFRAGKEMGLFSEVPTPMHSVPMPEGGPLSWGVAHGTYTTPEIAEYLAFQKKWKDQMDDGVLHWLKGIKTAKTMFSPKAWGHSIFGNTFFFGPLAGVTPMTHVDEFKDAWNVLSDAEKILNGKLPKSHPSWAKYEELLRNGIVGNEIANRDELVGLAAHIDKPWEQAKSLKDIRSYDDFVKFVGKGYSNQDALYKIAAYNNYVNKRGMTPEAAAKEVYKWFPDPKNASKFAQEARNTTVGTLFLNPFTTFQSEAHRIMLNAWNESPKSRFILASMMGSRLAFNAGVLAYAGHGIGDMLSMARTRPEVASEVLFNPTNPNFDLNVKYIDPFNTSGLFAPLMALSGATNTNPFDYLLDFTQFSPEFGYSNFLVSAIQPLLTGKGKHGEDLSLADRLYSVMDAHLSSSFTKDLPKALNLDGTVDVAEQQRRALRFFGFDAEARNADYIKRDVQKDLTHKVEAGKDLTTTARVLDFMGFDSKQMIEDTKKRVEAKRLAEQKKKLFNI